MQRFYLFVIVVLSMLLGGVVFAAGVSTLDDYAGRASEVVTAPANDAVAVTMAASDVSLDKVCRGIRNQTTAAIDVKVRMRSGNDFTYKNIQPGATEPTRADKIYVTGTTALVELGILY